jgi:hypothetical protein
MWFTWIISNWKLILIGALGLAIAGLVTAYSWQRTSLAKSEASVRELRAVSAAQALQIKVQKDNLEEIKNHQDRVQVIERVVTKIQEVIREVPVIQFEGNCDKPEEVRKDEAKDIERAAGIIVDYFNTGVFEGFDTSDSGSILPKTGSTDADRPKGSE